MDLDNLAKLQTEGVNPRTTNIDRVSTLEMCTVINGDDHFVAESIVPCLPVIADAIDAMTTRVRQGGRIVYVGAGTSGRLGVLDASEIPPTFAAPRSQFIGLIAGGDAAIRQAQEGAEDSDKAGEEDLAGLNLDPKLDSVIGIASSGRTPYVLGCLAFAKKLKCLTIGVVCTSPSAMGLSGNVDYLVAPLPGAEVVTGSTRLKAGTATKMVLNMLSTGTMIRTGKTYGNMMVDLKASNLKLEQRSRNILRRASPKCRSLLEFQLDALLEKCNRSVKLAILVAETSESVEKCQELLALAGGVLSEALLTSFPHISRISKDQRRFVLCIDGGGSKCAAVIVDESDALGYGSAGPCNLTDNASNVDLIISTIIEATTDALKDHIPDVNNLTGFHRKELLQSCFRRVWIGLAGMDRSGLYDVIGPKLTELFGLDDASDALKITNDVSLLTAAVSEEQSKPSILVMIAGTGSVAMRYNWTENDGYTPVARAGGWGHLLGDEGGGYSIGLEAAKYTLFALEERALGLKLTPLGAIEQAVIDKLGCHDEGGGQLDLLSEILSQNPTQSFKTRIAALAEMVLNLRESSTARNIIDRQISYIVKKTLCRVADLRSSGYVAPEKTELILAGGLMKNTIYQQILRMQLAQKGLQFRAIHVVDNAAVVAARYLVSNGQTKV
ncbi:hypothetical protein N7478_006073 [Penicillium angulare]|uniref:uncharacterized protein n=1 Tax=Penicillium angulare TaxID=116970 RepID=UPI0025420A84|nr:uncharacterized protein N7478_006073 [Penicillium angulare]KAJ5280701.1 hypothetical protein N7478_006073 [Penicillium angulare]